MTNYDYLYDWSSFDAPDTPMLMEEERHGIVTDSEICRWFYLQINSLHWINIFSWSKKMLIQCEELILNYIRFFHYDKIRSIRTYQCVVEDLNMINISLCIEYRENIQFWSECFRITRKSGRNVSWLLIVYIVDHE